MKIFICGIPASGKSEFGKKLEQDFGYYHIDAENWPKNTLHDAWDDIFNDISKIDNFVRMAGENVVFDLGFRVTPTSVGFIVALKSRGYFVIWFECPSDVARERYLKRRRGSIELFEQQMSHIRDNRHNIDKVISPITINVLRNGSQKSTKELYEEIKKRVSNFLDTDVGQMV